MSAPADQPVVVEAIDLTKIYGDSKTIQVRALDQVSLKIVAREFVAVMGPSGSGKSTLLHLVGALDAPTSGKVLVNGQDISMQHDLDGFRSRTVGFIFQLHNLIPTLTALENVEVPMQGQGLGDRARRARAAELLELVGLGDRVNHLPGQLSGGQRQKVAIARALANSPSIVLADEPTGNLDSTSGNEVMGVLEQLNREQGTTIMLVTHDPNVARRTRRILIMRDGRIVQEDKVGDVYTEDLKVLARSELGRAVLNQQSIEWMKQNEEEVVRALLTRVTG
jgi:ABC-type lipoprotein export system ATPase subunit